MQNMMASEEVKPINWRIHIGAHKTATTHLQDNLAAKKSDLSMHGVNFFSRKEIREIGLNSYVSGKFEKNPFHVFKAGRLRRRLTKESQKTILISEELILGTAKDVLDGIYPFAERRIHHLLRLVRDDPVELFLSIRSQNEILPSAYVQRLRSKGEVNSFDYYLERWLSDTPTWTDLINRIQMAVPRARLTVWTLDTYSRQPLRILQRFSGVEQLTYTDFFHPTSTARLSRQTVKELEKVKAGTRKIRYGEYVELIENSDENDPYDPLNESQKALLHSVYEKDIDRIRNMGGIELLEWAE